METNQHTFQMLTSFDIVIRPAVTCQSRTISPFSPPIPLSTLPAYRSNKGFNSTQSISVPYNGQTVPNRANNGFLSRVCDVMFMKKKPMKIKRGRAGGVQPFWTSTMENGPVSPRFKAVTVSRTDDDWLAFAKRMGLTAIPRTSSLRSPIPGAGFLFHNVTNKVSCLTGGISEV